MLEQKVIQERIFPCNKAAGVQAMFLKVDHISIEEESEQSRYSTLSDKEDDYEVYEFENDPEMSKSEKDFQRQIMEQLKYSNYKPIK